MLYTVWKIEGQQASEITQPGSRIAAECAAITLNAHAAEGVRYMALPLGGSPFDLEPELQPCGCYSCGGQCGGNQDPGWCGPLADVAGKPICEACRERADVFADEDSRRIGMQARADEDRVVVRPDVFSGLGHTVYMSTGMARELAARLLAAADEATGWPHNG